MGRTRGSGEGTIYKNGKSWRGQIIIGGERLSVSGRTRREVSEKLAELRTKDIHREHINSNNITVSRWVEEWLLIKKEPYLSYRSYKLLVSQMRLHIIPSLGKYKLQDLNKFIIEKEFINNFSTGKKGTKKYKEKEYATATVLTVFRHFSSCIQYAVDFGLISKNPCQGVKIQKYSPSKKVYAYTQVEQDKIITKCKYSSMYYRFFYFLISTGLRFGEAAALTWDDIDFPSGKIYIYKTTIRSNQSIIIQNKTKTPAGTRTIYLGENIIAWLKWHKKQTDGLNKNNYVFFNMRGNLLDHSNTVTVWKRLCKELSIEYRGMHALRHTWATRALEFGVDIKTVSNLLGHTSVIITMDVYQDVLDNQKIKAACTLNAQY